MGKIERDWQEIDQVLKMFGQRVSDARRRYQSFVKKGIATPAPRIPLINPLLPTVLSIFPPKKERFFIVLFT